MTMKGKRISRGNDLPNIVSFGTNILFNYDVRNLDLYLIFIIGLMSNFALELFTCELYCGWIKFSPKHF